MSSEKKSLGEFRAGSYICYKSNRGMGGGLCRQNGRVIGVDIEKSEITFVLPDARGTWEFPIEYPLAPLGGHTHGTIEVIRKRDIPRSLGEFHVGSYVRETSYGMGGSVTHGYGRVLRVNADVPCLILHIFGAWKQTEIHYPPPRDDEPSSWKLEVVPKKEVPRKVLRSVKDLLIGLSNYKRALVPRSVKPDHVLEQFKFRRKNGKGGYEVLFVPRCDIDGAWPFGEEITKAFVVVSYFYETGKDSEVLELHSAFQDLGSAAIEARRLCILEIEDLVRS